MLIKQLNYKHILMITLKNFIIDVNSVSNKSQFINKNKRKINKIFGSDDNDALKILSEFINIQFITSDRRGFKNKKNYLYFR